MSSRNSCRTKIVGLSGGIASGKNFIAEIFAKKGAAIFDADKEVHHLISDDPEVLAAIEKIFPESVIDQKIDRKTLAKVVFGDRKKLEKLEAILHPRVRENYRQFLDRSKKNNQKFVVLNIPLLLEAEGYDCDFVVAITAPIKLRKERYLARLKNADPKLFDKIRAKQISDKERKSRADFVIKNDQPKEVIEQKIEAILREILAS